jgi:Spy/CpxP family protein refolding chaperone
MTKQRWCGVAAAALWAAGSLATVATADEPSGSEPRASRRAGERGGALAEYLGLTEAQKASWRALHEQRRDEMKPLAEEGKALRKRQREAIEAQAPDPGAVGEATLAVEAHRRRVGAQHEAFQARLEGLLNSEQKEKLKAFEAARRALGSGRDGRRGPRPARRPAEAPSGS